jgi:hypothetical protein
MLTESASDTAIADSRIITGARGARPRGLAEVAGSGVN